VSEAIVFTPTAYGNETSLKDVFDAKRMLIWNACEMIMDDDYSFGQAEPLYLGEKIRAVMSDAKDAGKETVTSGIGFVIGIYEKEVEYGFLRKEDSYFKDFVPKTGAHLRSISEIAIITHAVNRLKDIMPSGMPWLVYHFHSLTLLARYEYSKIQAYEYFDELDGLDIKAELKKRDWAQFMQAHFHDVELNTYNRLNWACEFLEAFNLRELELGHHPTIKTDLKEKYTSELKAMNRFVASEGVISGRWNYKKAQQESLNPAIDDLSKSCKDHIEITDCLMKDKAKLEYKTGTDLTQSLTFNQVRDQVKQRLREIRKAEKIIGLNKNQK
jgi:hypothetical protein